MDPDISIICLVDINFICYCTSSKSLDIYHYRYYYYYVIIVIIPPKEKKRHNYKDDISQKSRLK